MASPSGNDLEMLLVNAIGVLRAAGYSPPPFPDDDAEKRKLLSEAKNAAKEMGEFAAAIVMLISFEQDAMSSPNFDRIQEQDMQFSRYRIRSGAAIQYCTATEVLAIVESFLDTWRAALEARKAHVDIPPAITELIRSLLALSSNAATGDMVGAAIAEQLTSARNDENTDKFDRAIMLAYRKYYLTVYQRFLVLIRSLNSAFGGVAARLEAATKLKTTDSPEAVIDDLVTLDQIAPLVGQSKRTLERYLKQGLIPEPDFRGGNGKAHKWLWRNLRPAIAKFSGRELPEKFPGSRIV